MKKTLMLALAVLLGGFAGTPSAGVTRGNSLEGDSYGTIVVWDAYHSGLPTAHARGRIMDDDGQVVGQFACRLWDNGDVTGTALTYLGPAQCGGKWGIGDDDEGEFEIEIEYADREIEVEGEFQGRRTYWTGDWEEEND